MLGGGRDRGVTVLVMGDVILIVDVVLFLIGIGAEIQASARTY